MTEPTLAEQFDDCGQQRQADLMGMWVFLATEMLLFGAVFAAFMSYRIRFPEAFAHAAGHLSLRHGTVNTAILLTSGLTMALAEQAIDGRRRKMTLAMLALTIILGLVFLGIKGYEWHHEYTEGLVPILGWTFSYDGPRPEVAQLFFNFYYTLTGLHAFHMAIGVGVLAVVTLLVRGWKKPDRLARQVQIAGLYWAFVDIVWIFVFTTLYLLAI